MCDNLKTIAKVRSGELSICCQCHIYHLEFNNIYLEFNENEFEQFKNYILNIEMAYWEEKYAYAKVKRKIPIPSLQKNLVLMFKREEINELKTLVANALNKTKLPWLKIDDIDYSLILN